CPRFLPPVCGLLLGSLRYRSRLVPRVLPVLGFIGATLLVAGDIAVLFGLIGQHAPSTGLLAIPIASSPVEGACCPMRPNSTAMSPATSSVAPMNPSTGRTRGTRRERYRRDPSSRPHTGGRNRGH